MVRDAVSSDGDFHTARLQRGLCVTGISLPYEVSARPHHLLLKLPLCAMAVFADPLLLGCTQHAAQLLGIPAALLSCLCVVLLLSQPSASLQSQIIKAKSSKFRWWSTQYNHCVPVSDITLLQHSQCIHSAPIRSLDSSRIENVASPESPTLLHGASVALCSGVVFSFVSTWSTYLQMQWWWLSGI